MRSISRTLAAHWRSRSTPVAKDCLFRGNLPLDSIVTAGPPISYLVSTESAKILDQIHLLMSSNEDDYNDGDNLSAQNSKKRRIQRACDICRRKKSMSKMQCRRNIFLYCIFSSMLVSFSSYRASPILISIIGDGVQMPGNRCSNCVSYSLECTYVEASKVWFCRTGVARGTSNGLSVIRNEGHQRGERIVRTTL